MDCLPPSRWPYRIPEESGPRSRLPHSSASPTQEAEARNSAGAGPEGSGAPGPAEAGRGAKIVQPDRGRLATPVPAARRWAGDTGGGWRTVNSQKLRRPVGGGWSSTQGFQDLGCRRLIQTAVLVTDRTQKRQTDPADS